MKSPDFDKLVERTGAIETGAAKSGGNTWAVTFLIQIIGLGGIAALVRWGVR